ncbi:MAG: type II toxin-antitoxin system RelE/ParE family toxin [Lachnospiraceae bacterium]|nr:type II toxin-antitoxin system RelE/ParE family toxin [Lachnospiraceae bacterium]
MTKYEVLVTNEALADMDRIFDYIAEKLLSPENAAGQYDRIADAILTLDTFPERHRVMESSNEKANGLRMMPVDNYCVFYCIRDKRVFVTDVLYGACDYESKLKGLD